MVYSVEVPQIMVEALLAVGLITVLIFLINGIVARLTLGK